ncbi:hypothetical protein DID88_004052 [Monilinia fructigena]|uniref:Uncharacterized protein n=1 Tax=Monilinia fructigena TaxID=38457 RepID=A0A395IRL6_9HELO|nr:hypothetical protein DID88_004052 [Monilinia fructigena]
MAEDLELVFTKIDELANAVAPDFNIINDRLAPAIKITSISSDNTDEGRNMFYAMTDFLETQLKGIKCICPVLAWLNALQAYQEAKVDVPVNLIFCFEGMEESGSIGFAAFAKDNQALFQHVDAACISDNYWLTTRKPCLTYWSPRYQYFKVTVRDPEYATIEFHHARFPNTIGSEANIYDDPKDTLMHRFRYPSLTIHGITGADPSPDQTTAIYPKVTAKFSIRTVPDMQGDAVTNLTIHYIEQEFRKLHSKNTCHVELFGESAPYWLGKKEDDNFTAGKPPRRKFNNTEPDLTREGGRSVQHGVTLDLQNALGDKSIMLLPVGMSDDGAHGPNEKINKDNYVKGSKLLGAYWWYFANPWPEYGH